MSEKIVNLTEEAETNKEQSLVVVFRKHFVFDDKEYTEIDLSGIKDLSGRQLCDIHREFNKSGAFAAVPQQSPEYAAITAHYATGKPIEFFMDLPARELTKITNRITGYFFDAD